MATACGLWRVPAATRSPKKERKGGKENTDLTTHICPTSFSSRFSALGISSLTLGQPRNRNTRAGNRSPDRLIGQLDAVRIHFWLLWFCVRRPVRLHVSATTFHFVEDSERENGKRKQLRGRLDNRRKPSVANGSYFTNKFLTFRRSCRGILQVSCLLHFLSCPVWTHDHPMFLRGFLCDH